MRPIPIPDRLRMPNGEHIDCNDPPGALKRMVIAGPDGDLTGDIRPVEALVGIDPEQGPMITILITFEAGELERLGQMTDPAIWLTVNTRQLSPFSLEVADGHG